MTNTATARVPHATACNRIDWSEIDDKALVDALVRHDESAWREFDRRYRSMIRKQVKATTRRSSTADNDLDDIVSDILCGLLANDCAKLRKLDAASNFRGWLQVVARNSGLSYLRMKRRRPEGQRLVDVEQAELSARQCGARWIAEGT